MDLPEKARVFATAAHAAVNQVRKYTGESYIEHPAELVHLLRAHDVDDPTILAAAWLHDVVEDTHISPALIEAEFGSEVAELVAGLTDVSRPEDGNRAQRKAIDRAHTAVQSPACKTIKLADLISNTRSIVERDPRFAEVYLEEKRLLLEVLTEGHPELWLLACQHAGVLVEEGSRLSGLTQEGLSDVDAGRVVDQQIVQDWADSLSSDAPELGPR